MSDPTPAGGVDPASMTPRAAASSTTSATAPTPVPGSGEAAIARALIFTGFRNAFGLGRSAKSKVLPFILLGMNLFPAVILVGALTLFGADELPIGYAQYASTTQVLLSIFVASQAPVLFSRDLRHGSITLYLARPLRASTYALSRWTSLLARDPGLRVAAARDHVRRRAARRARLRRADQGGVDRGLPRPRARPHPDRHRRARSPAGRPDAASRSWRPSPCC